MLGRKYLYARAGDADGKTSRHVFHLTNQLSDRYFCEIEVSYEVYKDISESEDVRAIETRTSATIRFIKASNEREEGKSWRSQTFRIRVDGFARAIVMGCHEIVALAGKFNASRNGHPLGIFSTPCTIRNMRSRECLFHGEAFSGSGLVFRRYYIAPSGFRFVANVQDTFHAFAFDCEGGMWKLNKSDATQGVSGRLDVWQAGRWCYIWSDKFEVIRSSLEEVSSLDGVRPGTKLVGKYLLSPIRFEAKKPGDCFVDQSTLDTMGIQDTLTELGIVGTFRGSEEEEDQTPDEAARGALVYGGSKRVHFGPIILCSFRWIRNGMALDFPGILSWLRVPQAPLVIDPWWHLQMSQLPDGTWPMTPRNLLLCGVRHPHDVLTYPVCGDKGKNVLMAAIVIAAVSVTPQKRLKRTCFLQKGGLACISRARETLQMLMKENLIEEAKRNFFPNDKEIPGGVTGHGHLPVLEPVSAALLRARHWPHDGVPIVVSPRALEILFLSAVDRAQPYSLCATWLRGTSFLSTRPSTLLNSSLTNGSQKRKPTLGLPGPQDTFRILTTTPSCYDDGRLTHSRTGTFKIERIGSRFSGRKKQHMDTSDIQDGGCPFECVVRFDLGPFTVYTSATPHARHQWQEIVDVVDKEMEGFHVQKVHIRRKKKTKKAGSTGGRKLAPSDDDSSDKKSEDAGDGRESSSDSEKEKSGSGGESEACSSERSDSTVADDDVHPTGAGSKPLSAKKQGDDFVQPRPLVSEKGLSLSFTVPDRDIVHPSTSLAEAKKGEASYEGRKRKKETTPFLPEQRNAVCAYELNEMLFLQITHLDEDSLAFRGPFLFRLWVKMITSGVRLTVVGFSSGDKVVRMKAFWRDEIPKISAWNARVILRHVRGVLEYFNQVLVPALTADGRRREAYVTGLERSTRTRGETPNPYLRMPLAYIEFFPGARALFVRMLDDCATFIPRWLVDEVSPEKRFRPRRQPFQKPIEKYPRKDAEKNVDQHLGVSTKPKVESTDALALLGEYDERFNEIEREALPTTVFVCGDCASEQCLRVLLGRLPGLRPASAVVIRGLQVSVFRSYGARGLRSDVAAIDFAEETKLAKEGKKNQDKKRRKDNNADGDEEDATLPSDEDNSVMPWNDPKLAHRVEKFDGMVFICKGDDLEVLRAFELERIKRPPETVAVVDYDGYSVVDGFPAYFFRSISLYSNPDLPSMIPNEKYDFAKRRRPGGGSMPNSGKSTQANTPRSVPGDNQSNEPNSQVHTARSGDCDRSARSVGGGISEMNGNNTQRSVMSHDTSETRADASMKTSSHGISPAANKPPAKDESRGATKVQELESFNTLCMEFIGRYRRRKPLKPLPAGNPPSVGLRVDEETSVAAMAARQGVAPATCPLCAAESRSRFGASWAERQEELLVLARSNYLLGITNRLNAVVTGGSACVSYTYGVRCKVREPEQHTRHAANWKNLSPQEHAQTFLEDPPPFTADMKYLLPGPDSSGWLYFDGAIRRRHDLPGGVAVLGIDLTGIDEQMRPFNILRLWQRIGGASHLQLWAHPLSTGSTPPPTDEQWVCVLPWVTIPRVSRSERVNEYEALVAAVHYAVGELGPVMARFLKFQFINDGRLGVPSSVIVCPRIKLFYTNPDGDTDQAFRAERTGRIFAVSRLHQDALSQIRSLQAQTERRLIDLEDQSMATTKVHQCLYEYDLDSNGVISYIATDDSQKSRIEMDEEEFLSRQQMRTRRLTGVLRAKSPPTIDPENRRNVTKGMGGQEVSRLHPLRTSISQPLRTEESTSAPTFSSAPESSNVEKAIHASEEAVRTATSVATPATSALTYQKVISEYGKRSTEVYGLLEGAEASKLKGVLSAIEGPQMLPPVSQIRTEALSDKVRPTDVSGEDSSFRSLSPEVVSCDSASERTGLTEYPSSATTASIQEHLSPAESSERTKVESRFGCSRSENVGEEDSQEKARDEDVRNVVAREDSSCSRSEYDRGPVDGDGAEIADRMEPGLPEREEKGFQPPLHVTLRKRGVRILSSFIPDPKKKAPSPSDGSLKTVPFDVDDVVPIATDGLLDAAASGVARGPPVRFPVKAGEWLSLDLGENRRLCPTKYLLRVYTQGSTCLPRHWDIQGSNDAKKWKTLAMHRGDTTLEPRAGCVGVWSIARGDATDHYRFFRIVIRGLGESVQAKGPRKKGDLKNSRELCDHCRREVSLVDKELSPESTCAFILGGIEFYGQLRTDTTLAERENLVRNLSHSTKMLLGLATEASRRRQNLISIHEGCLAATNFARGEFVLKRSLQAQLGLLTAGAVQSASAVAALVQRNPAIRMVLCNRHASLETAQVSSSRQIKELDSDANILVESSASVSKPSNPDPSAPGVPQPSTPERDGVMKFQPTEIKTDADLASSFLAAIDESLENRPVRPTSVPDEGKKVSFREKANRSTSPVHRQVRNPSKPPLTSRSTSPHTTTLETDTAHAGSRKGSTNESVKGVKDKHRRTPSPSVNSRSSTPGGNKSDAGTTSGSAITLERVCGTQEYVEETPLEDEIRRLTANVEEEQKKRLKAEGVAERSVREMEIHKRIRDEADNRITDLSQQPAYKVLPASLSRKQRFDTSKSVNWLNEVQTGGTARVVGYYGLKCKAYQAESTQAPPTATWALNGALIDTHPFTNNPHYSFRLNEGTGTCFTNGPGSTGIILVDLTLQDKQTRCLNRFVHMESTGGGSLTHLRIWTHPESADCFGCPRWNDHRWVCVLPWQHSRGSRLSDVVDGYKVACDPDLWEVDSFTTRFLRIDMRNDGSAGDGGNIVCRQLKAFGPEAGGGCFEGITFDRVQSLRPYGSNGVIGTVTCLGSPDFVLERNAVELKLMLRNMRDRSPDGTASLGTIRKAVQLKYSWWADGDASLAPRDRTITALNSSFLRSIQPAYLDCNLLEDIDAEAKAKRAETSAVVSERRRALRLKRRDETRLEPMRVWWRFVMSRRRSWLLELFKVLRRGSGEDSLGYLNMSALREGMRYSFGVAPGKTLRDLKMRPQSSISNDPLTDDGNCSETAALFGMWSDITLQESSESDSLTECDSAAPSKGQSTGFGSARSQQTNESSSSVARSSLRAKAVEEKRKRHAAKLMKRKEKQERAAQARIKERNMIQKSIVGVLRRLSFDDEFWQWLGVAVGSESSSYEALSESNRDPDAPVLFDEFWHLICEWWKKKYDEHFGYLGPRHTIAHLSPTVSSASISTLEALSLAEETGSSYEEFDEEASTAALRSRETRRRKIESSSSSKRNSTSASKPRTKRKVSVPSESETGSTISSASSKSSVTSSSSSHSSSSARSRRSLQDLSSSSTSRMKRVKAGLKHRIGSSRSRETSARTSYTSSSLLSESSLSSVSEDGKVRRRRLDKYSLQDDSSNKLSRKSRHTHDASKSNTFREKEVTRQKNDESSVCSSTSLATESFGSENRIGDFQVREEAAIRLQRHYRQYRRDGYMDNVGAYRTSKKKIAAVKIQRWWRKRIKAYKKGMLRKQRKPKLGLRETNEWEENKGHMSLGQVVVSHQHKWEAAVRLQRWWRRLILQRTEKDRYLSYTRRRDRAARKIQREYRLYMSLRLQRQNMAVSYGSTSFLEDWKAKPTIEMMRRKRELTRQKERGRGL